MNNLITIIIKQTSITYKSATNKKKKIRIRRMFLQCISYSQVIKLFLFAWISRFVFVCVNLVVSYGFVYCPCTLRNLKLF